MAAFVFAASAAGAAPDAQAAPLRAMSFNVRYSTAQDGENAWPRRREMLMETIRAFDPDLLGTQETLADQADFLSEQLKGHTLVGVGRDDGKRAGEFAALLFRSERFELVESGHFWLSETPDRPGSKSWDSAITRMASWVRLRDKRNENRGLLYLNTHWDHVGQAARRESARLIRRWLAERARGDAVVVTGDFNCDESSEPYRELVGKEGDGFALVDSFRKVTPTQSADEATYHGFGGKTAGERIDWILATPDLTPTAAAIDRTGQGGRYPSDHFPVTAVFSFRAVNK